MVGTGILYYSPCSTQPGCYRDEQVYTIQYSYKVFKGVRQDKASKLNQIPNCLAKYKT